MSALLGFGFFVLVWVVFYRVTKVKGMSQTVSLGGGFLVAIMALALPNMLMSETKEPTPNVAASSPAEERKARIRKLFRQWDGSLPALVEMVKESMHNPDSFDHVKTSAYDMGDHLVVNMEYRGSNLFGGIVTNKVKVKTSLDGKITEILEQ